MTDYFEEMGWTPLGEGETPNHDLHFARLLRDYGLLTEEQIRYMLAGGPDALPPPASKEIVENLPTKTVTTSGEKCPVCIKVYDVNEKVKLMPCNHMYHNDCIVPWLQKTNSCPLCRHELPTDNKDYEELKKQKAREKQREAAIEELHNSMFS